MSVGKDYSFGVFDSNTNQIVDLGDIQTFSVHAQKHSIKSMPYNNVPKYGYIPDGYSGDFRIMRTRGTAELLQIQLSAIFNTGGIVQPGFINEIINNPDGSVFRFQYIGAVFWMNKLADGSRDKVIDQDVEWMASDLVQVA